MQMESKDGAIHLHIDVEVGDPEEGSIEGFAIAGDDRRFQPAVVAYQQVDEDDRGHCVLLHESIPPELEGQAHLGEQNCPEGAITIQPD